MARCARPGCEQLQSGTSLYCSLDCLEECSAPPVADFLGDLLVTSPDMVEYSATTFRQYGLCLLESCLPPELLDESRHIVEQNLELCRKRMAERGLNMFEDPFSFREIVHRSKGRFDMQLGHAVAPVPLDKPSLMESAPWAPIVHQILGNDAKLLFTGAVISCAGADGQDPHTDGYQISEASNDPHCLTIFVPLVDVNETNGLGSTRFWPGSQLRHFQEFDGTSPGFTPDYHVGSAVIFDYRLVHCGLPNEGAVQRPVLYMVWAKPWYEENNFPGEVLFTSRGNEN